MAFLLGDSSCINSLRSDLSDIQQTIDEIIVRSGPIKCYSWKTPDKLASELGIEELLERYSHSEDEVHNQISHYSLLELIIDRLLLLIYLSTNFAEQTLSTDSIATSSKVTRLSAGLSIKKYWNKYTSLCSSYRHLHNQTKSNGVKKISQDIRKSKDSIKSLQLEKQAMLSGSTRNIADEVSNKSVQTNETAFVPCESCAKVQTNLKHNADQIINICHYQNIQSQVGKYRASLMANQLVGGWLSGPELEKWLAEQDKDLSRISKQIEFLSKNNDLLKSKLNENEGIIKKLNQSEKDTKKELKEEKDNREIIIKQYEKKIGDTKTEMKTKISGLESEIKNLNQIVSNLEEKNQNLKSLYENNEKIVVELTETNKIMTSEINTNTENRIKIVKLEEEKLSLKKEIDLIKRELDNKTSELNKESSKLEELTKSEQSLKLKLESMTESLDKTSAERDSFKKKVEFIDEEKHQLVDSLKSKENTIQNLKYESEILQNSLENLKQEVKQLRDNESLLIRYPDFYGPMEQLNDDELNVVEDMQNQIRANKHRINLLEKLNTKLINSINKLNETMTSYQCDNVCASLEEKNYFMKPTESSSRSQSVLESAEEQKYSYTRPVPFYKLENEIQNDSKDDTSAEPNYETILNNSKKYWNQDESLKPKTEIESDEEFDFLKNKRQSDQSYLEKLNQISNGTELKVENSDFTFGKNSRRGYKDSNPYIFSPSTSSMTNHSRLSQHSNRSKIKTPPIPPADKNMEVIVGKGRRINSANSTRSNSSSNKNSNKRPDSARSRPPTSGRKTASAEKTIYKCNICEKSYEDSKNFDIHKLYCTKRNFWHKEMGCRASRRRQACVPMANPCQPGFGAMQSPYGFSSPGFGQMYGGFGGYGQSMMPPRYGMGMGMIQPGSFGASQCRMY